MKEVNEHQAEIGKLYLFNEEEIGRFHSRTSLGYINKKESTEIKKDEPIFLFEKRLVKRVDTEFMLCHALTKRGIFYLNFSKIKLKEV